MNSYVDKFYELIEKGYDIDSTAENIYLNYNAIGDNDLIYSIKRKISEAYLCDLNDIKLIGSSHTGFSVESESLALKENPNDYDFAIINANIFIRYFHRTCRDDLPDKKRLRFEQNFLMGKIHPMYENPTILEELNDINKKIQLELKLEKHISLCFYLSEKSFINGLSAYFNKVYATYLRQLSTVSKIQDIGNLEIKTLDKLNGGN